MSTENVLTSITQFHVRIEKSTYTSVFLDLDRHEKHIKNLQSNVQPLRSINIWSFISGLSGFCWHCLARISFSFSFLCSISLPCEEKNYILKFMTKYSTYFIHLYHLHITFQLGSIADVCLSITRDYNWLAICVHTVI